jgi:subtilase family serine protease
VKFGLEDPMNKLEQLAASVSALALMSSGAAAAVVAPAPGVPSAAERQEKIARLPMQRDMNRQREFYVLLKPEASGSADAVQAYFRSFGFQTEYIPDTNSVKLRGSFFQAERAGNFRYVPGRLPITPLRVSTKPSFPDPVASAILATTFNRGPVMRSLLTVHVNVPTTMPDHLGVTGLAPSDYGAIYGYDAVYAAGFKGKGETIDIATCFGYVKSDLATFQSDFGLSPAPNVTAVTSNLPSASPSSFEPDLDVQRAYGTAPGAAIRMWFSQSCALGDFTNLFLDIAADQKAHPAAALSVSYGLSELAINTLYGTSLFVGAEAALSKITGGASQKVALFVASGDDGDFTLFDAVNLGSPLGQADVAYFASDPNVLAVGGTSLILNSKFTRADEYAWSGSATGNSGGSGGGISNIWTIPSWQKGVPGTASQIWKNVPDVSSVASLNSPPLMVSAAFGGLIQVGGTSAASPTWAGTVALLQQQYQKTHGGARRADWPAYFYNKTTTAGLFTDVTAGSNGRFIARPGYDNVTGLGVPCLLHFPSPCVGGK